jgi:hypothetical protein
MEMGRYGKELRKAQDADESTYEEEEPNNYYLPGRLIGKPVETTNVPTTFEQPPVETRTKQPDNTPAKKTQSKGNIAVDPNIIKKYEDRNIAIDFKNVGERTYSDVQRSEVKNQKQLPGRYGDASLNEQGWLKDWGQIYPNASDLIASLETYQPAADEKYKNP